MNELLPAGCNCVHRVRGPTVRVFGLCGNIASRRTSGVCCQFNGFTCARSDNPTWGPGIATMEMDNNIMWQIRTGFVRADIQRTDIGSGLMDNSTSTE
jgi:hypothetical protein